jgi:hypothetical protein
LFCTDLQSEANLGTRRWPIKPKHIVHTNAYNKDKSEQQPKLKEDEKITLKSQIYTVQQDSAVYQCYATLELYVKKAYCVEGEGNLAESSRNVLWGDHN